jgi:septal ring factor EnvC (AmiA/AmiB activator)
MAAAESNLGTVAELRAENDALLARNDALIQELDALKRFTDKQQRDLSRKLHLSEDEIKRLRHARDNLQLEVWSLRAAAKPADSDLANTAHVRRSSREEPASAEKLSAFANGDGSPAKSSDRVLEGTNSDALEQQPPSIWVSFKRLALT